MNAPKVFIGIITAEAKSYAEDLFFLHLNRLTYPNKEVLIVDNSDDLKYIQKLREYGYKCIKEGARSDIRERIVISRNRLRNEFLKGDCEYFFSLESDVLPEPDVIERLMIRRREIVSGIYCFNSGAPIAYGYSAYDDTKRQRIRTDVCRDNKLLSIKVVGLGLLLVRREIIQQIKFRWKEGHTGTDDVWFCIDALEKGYRVYLDTAVKAKHYGSYLGMERIIEFGKCA